VSLNDSPPVPVLLEEELVPRPAPDAAPVAATDAEPKINWWHELRAIFFLVLAVLGFHSLVAKPFYIPSESMMPGLLKGDRLVVSKYPYGWSWASPSFHVLPRASGRLLGSMPERGDVVIVAHPGDGTDYIKRVVGLPGDTIALSEGQLIINGRPVPRRRMADAMIPIDENLQCMGDPVTGADGRPLCRLPIYRETLPNGSSYDTIDVGYFPEADDRRPVVVPEGHVFLMGDNRDHSADSRFPLYDAAGRRLGLDGPVPWENVGGRAEFITFSLDGSSDYWNPISWFTALRGGRTGTSLHPRQSETQGR